MLSTLPKTNLNFSVTFILLSASALNLDWSKFLLFGRVDDFSHKKNVDQSKLIASVQDNKNVTKN